MTDTETAANLVERLRGIPIFEHVTEDRLQALVELMSTRQIAAGDVLVREGDVGDEMFVLLEGQVRISKTTLDQERYTVAVLDGAQTPFFGEMAMLDADRRSATIDAVRDSQLLALRRDDFEKFGNDHPEVGWVVVRALARMVSEKLRHANEDALLLFEALVNEVRSKATG